jgi:NAD(P)H-dependent FMN reductase
MTALQLAVLVGSTRPGRRGPAIGRWVHDHAARRDDVKAEILDVADFELPLLDEPLPARSGRYDHPHTRAWSAAVASFDAFLVVTPEYNRSVPAALKNAIDFLYAEWHDKAAGIVSYGSDAGGARAAEHLRGVLGELQVADVRATVALTRFEDFDDTGFAPAPRREAELTVVLDQVVRWGTALRTLRVPQ